MCIKVNSCLRNTAVFDACVLYSTWHYLSEAHSVFVLIALCCWPGRGLQRKRKKKKK